jgi:hypothetical protein
MGTMQQTSATDIETTIRSLKDVLSARVVLSKTGTIEEIHVFTTSTRAPKQMVRDVESALMAEFGLVLDHKKVSIAQTQDSTPIQSDDRRLKFSDVAISLNGAKAEATVHLSRNGDTYTGMADGHSSSHNQLRLIATSTLRAVENSHGSDGLLVLEDLNPAVTLSGRGIVVVCVNMMTPRGEDLLAGSAVVKQDMWKAVVNATLDAVNRRVTAFTQETDTR